MLPKSTQTEELQSEYESLRRLEHPYIIRYKHLQLLYTKSNAKIGEIYMEYCRDGNLLSWCSNLETRGLKPDEVDIWHYIKQIASTLIYCHYRYLHVTNEDIKIDTKMDLSKRSRILHRDIKPDNIFLFYDVHGKLSVKLGDFGHSVELKIEHPDFKTHWNHPFVAPEIREGNSKVVWTEKRDIYSRRCTIYFMCSGSMPKTELESILSGQFDKYTENLKVLMRACFQPTPTDRPDACKIYNIAVIALLENKGMEHSTRDPDPSFLQRESALNLTDGGKFISGKSEAATLWSVE
ncbi:kinase-like protein [Patellaria atrata CBS 101060]|uniref:non-specific serine/threonine protein kinase n=1 Tax=Patellaria atrata CBS 101060 TaxID=1346257 RepID=A0A9P4VWK6_9PEZI|nr:kinase-like protein [Patellaria atrata CBS 101060]